MNRGQRPTLDGLSTTLLGHSDRTDVFVHQDNYKRLLKGTMVRPPPGPERLYARALMFPKLSSHTRGGALRRHTAMKKVANRDIRVWHFVIENGY